MKTLLLILAVAVSAVSQAQQNTTNLDPLGIPNKKAINNSLTQQERNSIELSEHQTINTIPAPTNLITDITYYNNLIWAIGYGEYQIIGINPETGEKIDSIPINILRPYGLSYYDNHFYILDNENKLIEKVDVNTKEVTDTIYLPDTMMTYPTGLTVIDGDIWYNDPRGPYAQTSEDDYLTEMSQYDFKCTFTHSICNYPTGLTFDGSHIWTTDGSTQIIYMIDNNTNTAIKAINAPGGIYPNGLCWDGEYLWVANNASDSIYKLDIGTLTTNINYEDNNIDEINIYPQPAKNYINIKINNTNSTKIKIGLYNNLGQKIDDINNKNNINNIVTINLNKYNLSSGIYYLHFQLNNNTITKKLIIN